MLTFGRSLLLLLANGLREHPHLSGNFSMKFAGVVDEYFLYIGHHVEYTL